MDNQLLFVLTLAALVIVGLVAAALVTRQRQAAAAARAQAAALERELRHYKAILDAVSEGIFYAENHQVRYANRALSRLVGYHPETAVWPEQPAPPELASLYRSMSSAIAREGSSGLLKIRRKDGSDLDARVSSAPLNGGSGTVTTIRDNTQEAALQTQRTRFVSNAAHELRTPVANLKMRLYLLQRQPEKMAAHIEVMEQVVSRMQSLIEEMLEFSEYERGSVLMDREDVVLQDLVKEVMTSYQPKAERRAISLTADLPSAPLRVFADPKRLNQVLINLVSNAMNHTREGGKVHITAEIEPALTRRGHRYVILKVQDNGVGIAEDLLTQVFAPFSMPKNGDLGGTALGLTISKEIVEQHGGEIMAESEIGKGTIFTVRLQLAE